MLRTLSLLLSCCLILACGDDSGSTIFVGDDATDAADGTATGDADGDADADADPRNADEDTGPPACHSFAPTGETFEIDPDGPTTQIHAQAAFDGDGVWVIYNAAGDEGAFDVWLTRLDCAGNTTHPPRRLNTTVGPNVTEPAIAIGYEAILTLWQRDDPELESNLDIAGRVLDLDGEPLSDEDAVYELSRDGTPQSGNAWMPAAVGDDEGFVLVGAWGHDEATAFQVFVQRLSPLGEPVGDAQDVELDPGNGQVFPTVSTSDLGTLVAWTYSPVAGDDAGKVARVDGETFGPTTVDFIDGAHAAEGGGVALVAGGSAGDGDVHVARVAADGTLGTPLQLGERGRVDIAGTPAIDPNGLTGALMYYRVVQGIRNQVVVTGLDLSEDVHLASEFVIPDVGDAAPYTPSITAIGGNTYLLVWSAGASPDLRLYGRFVRL